ncbi:hypothetical protein LPA06_17700 [Lacticaseibacillus paracasei subsp. tolerans]|nr:hypothetical protein LPA06_17700 [Lacticaseibacillus paracasei subsp. tolerans]
MNGRTQEKLENAVTEFVVAQLKNKGKSPRWQSSLYFLQCCLCYYSSLVYDKGFL